MNWFTRRTGANLLDEYWDNVVRRQPSLPMPPPDAPADAGAMIRRLQTLEHDDPERPAYAGDLLQRLLATYDHEETTMSAHTATAPLSPPRAKPGHSAPPLPDRWNPHVRRRSWNFGAALAIALVAMLIFAGLAGIWMSSQRGNDTHILAPPLATPATEASPDVPMYRGNPERTGVFPGPGIEGDPVELWRLEFEGAINSAPAIVDGVLYVGVGDGNLHALDAATGEEIWSFAAASPIGSSPAMADGLVYVGSDDGTLYAVNAADGTEVWTFPGGAQNASVVVIDGLVFTGSADGFVYALDAATGEEHWKAPLGDTPSRSPMVADGVVYIGSVDGILHSFVLATGEPGWTFQGEGGGVIATTAFGNGLVYQTMIEGADNSYAYALDPATGEVVWRFAQEFNPGILPPVVGADLVYLPSADGSLYAVDAMTGEEAWRFDAGDNVDASPALVGDTLYVAPRDGFVYALDAASGVEIWRFAVEGPTVFGPTVSGGVAYAGTQFGYLYAIGGTGMATVSFPGDASVPATPEPAATPVATPVASAEVATFLWATTGGPEPLDRPADLTIAPDGSIWVPDGGNSRFQIFSPDGDFIETWGASGDGEGEFNFIRPNSQGDVFGAVAFAPDGAFYVADMGNQRIQHFSADRQFLNAWGSFGTDDGEFLSPIDIVVDSQGNVFVDDDKRNDIQKFTADGTFLLKFGGSGREPGQLDFQGWMAIDAEDNIWVTEGRNTRVQQFTNDGQLLTVVDGGGTLGAPEGIAVDDWGHIFVADWDGLRVVVLDPDGTVIAEWRPPDGLQLQEITNISLDGEGNMYVVSYLDDMLLKFQLNPPLVDGVAATPAP